MDLLQILVGHIFQNPKNERDLNNIQIMPYLINTLDKLNGKIGQDRSFMD